MKSSQPDPWQLEVLIFPYFFYQFNKKANKTCNFKTANYPDLYKSLCDIHWSIIDNFYETCNVLYSILLCNIDARSPASNLHTKTNPSWHTADIIHNIRMTYRSFIHFSH